MITSVKLILIYVYSKAQTFAQVKNKVNINFIAEKSGYSVSTVSRVINKCAKEYRISDNARTKILKISDKYGYHANPVAVNLRVKRSHTLGLLVPDLENPFFVNLVRVINSKFGEKGYCTIVKETKDNAEEERKGLNELIERNIDGIMLVPSIFADENGAYIEEIIKKGIPLICVDRYIDNTNIPFVVTDNEKGAYKAVSYLIQKGHKKIACIQGLESSSPCRDRKQGYINALKDAGLKPFYIGGNEFNLKCGYEEACKLLSNNQKPTAIFAMSSTIALGVIKAIKEFGLSMPDDISLFGFDNNIFLDFLAVPLTTVAQPVEVIGEKVAEYLILSIKKVLNDEWKNITVEPKLIIRESV